MNILIAGIQGSGKGTHSKLLAKKLKIFHISFGDTIKECFKTYPDMILPYTIEKYNKGELATDDVLFKIANKFIPEIEKKYNGFILDGFPRTIGQMNFVLQHYNIDKFLKLNIPDNIAINRMLARKRSDDTPESIKKRLYQYHTITEPCFLKIKNLIEIDSNGTILETQDKILKALNIK